LPAVRPSIMPFVTGGTTGTPAMMIGEHATTPILGG
jgi:hypothetical protein